MHELLFDNTAGLWLTRTLIKDSLRVLNTPLSLMTHLKTHLICTTVPLVNTTFPFCPPKASTRANVSAT